MRRVPGIVLALVLLATTNLFASTASADIERLSRDVRPSFQAITLNLDPSLPEYTGSIRADITLGSSQEALRFHAQQMALKRVVLTSAGGEMALTTSEGDEGQIRATREGGAPIPPGAYTLEIDFSNDFDARATSLYRLRVDDAWYAFTQFEAVDARGAFPCFDEPSFKFPYQFTITVPAGQDAVSNTPVERDETANGKRTIVFARTKPLPSYLLAIAVGSLEFTPIAGTSIPTRVVTTKGKRNLTSAAVTTTPRILAALEKYFGRPYPYEKLDLIAVPEYAPGAMENPGAITYSDQFLLFDPQSMSVDQKRTLARFTSHEIAHMWFGDLVTMEWWDDLWLNEAFAEWMGDKIAAEVFPELEMRVSGLAATQAAYDADSRLTSRAIRKPVTTSVALLESADDLTYHKGHAVLAMVEQWLGPEKFRRGVANYLKEHEWGNAVEADLWRALSNASGRDVAAVGAAFFDQPGIPLVRAELLDRGRLRLSQSRFLYDGPQDTVVRRWRIPVSVRYPVKGTTRIHTILLSDETATVSLPGLKEAPAWIEPNAEETGYYRWRLGGDAMSRLAKQATRVLTPRERYGFLLNAYALLLAGSIPGDEYMKFLESFAGDPHPTVVDAAAGGVRAVRYYFVTPDLEAPFAKYVRRVLGPTLQRIGLEPSPGESPSTSALRPSLFATLADEGNDTALRAHARQLADRYLAGKSIDPSMLGSALQVAAIDGDSARFDAYQAHFEKGSVPSERSRLLLAIGSFRAPSFRARALAYNLSGPLKPQEHFAILQGMGSVPGQEDEVWEWFRTNYDAFSKSVPPIYLIFTPHMASGCSRERLEMARVFFADPAHSPAGAEAEFKKMESAVAGCVGLREREGPAVRAYLEKGQTAP